ncbi:hypothetical protein [Tenacibaculum finnmarkense]|uniref:hypothetical protein n=1 Tax=Tenacibaculum finnmarkense TaxID=2781243 RepID=UPI000C3B8B94|nr:hypothetical protein [Tenacibaculum finnmarkense]MBE7654019.1 hypothetical protein [Tenacibaculum finnmarkense genomovar finnmarkense]MCD8428564.1 hypothetical protein [Tenacibaculum finnmarkense genomovar finnmarkense]MCG8732363.1 hypothetical protein [Tenacibaculum finnmarkense]MCG8753133.1 hypothetical protein [Tenacibaculum finnmarkense]MCG8771343.1 hypothetical protein [Tenacibaculum finnmarkense]
MFVGKYNLRQLEIVEFSERVYHEGLRHKGINGSLYEDILIKFLREDLPDLCFFKGQIRDNRNYSSQFDIIIAKNTTKQTEFIKSINPYVSIVEKGQALGVIELKKWGNPKMISQGGKIDIEYQKFKKNFPELDYLLVCLRFKDRINKTDNNWESLKENIQADGKYCFFGRVSDKNKEWVFPWTENKVLLKENENYLNEYENLIERIKTLGNTVYN